MRFNHKYCFTFGGGNGLQRNRRNYIVIIVVAQRTRGLPVLARRSRGQVLSSSRDEFLLGIWCNKSNTTTTRYATRDCVPRLIMIIDGRDYTRRVEREDGRSNVTSFRRL